jgi:hypothetical protein
LNIVNKKEGEERRGERVGWKSIGFEEELRIENPLGRIGG